MRAFYPGYRQLHRLLLQDNGQPTGQAGSRESSAPPARTGAADETADLQNLSLAAARLDLAI
jgi:hypothetical protein